MLITDDSFLDWERHTNEWPDDYEEIEYQWDCFLDTMRLFVLTQHGWLLCLLQY